MAQIFCTKKLEKLLGPQQMTHEYSPNEKLGNWNANIFTMKRRKCLIMVNDVSYYSLLFFDIVKRDIINFHERFYQRLTEQLLYDEVNISEEILSQLYNHCKPTFLRTNNNRKVIGTMNECTQVTEYLFSSYYGGDFKQANLAEINRSLTGQLVGALRPQKNEYGYPIEEMQNLLRRL